jgi:histidine triad (HIT) family protein
MKTDPSCIFCQIVSGEEPAFKLYEDNLTVSFMDTNPVADGHVLVASKEHFADVFEVTPGAIAAVAATARRLAVAIQRAVDPPGLNLFQSNGDAANQSIYHFHMHVIPRHGGINMPMNWQATPGDLDLLSEIAERIRHQLRQG